jgi:hypothetical protein
MASNKSSNPWIPKVQQLQELEKIRFSYDLRKNPDDFNRYVSERVDRISLETLDKKRAAFQKAHTDMGRYFDMDHNAGFYKNRNRELNYIQTNLLEQSRAAVSGLKHDKDLTRRQTEVNEWYFNDKLETLFFLQMFFMVMLALSIILYFQKNGMITAPFAAFLTSILLVVVVGTGVYRSHYTSKTRDARFWHRRNFYDKKLYVPTKFESIEAKCNDIGNLLPKELTDCAAKGEKALLSAADKATAYAAESTKPYGMIALAGAEGVRGGFGVVGSGLGVAGGGLSMAGGGLGTAIQSPMIAAKALGSQALSDSYVLANKAGEAAARAETQLEADTIAYLTGDGRPKRNPNAKATCPF